MGFILMGISPYPLNNRRFTRLLVPPEGVHSTISNIGRDSRYWNTWTPGGRNSLSGRRSMRTKNKDKELNHRHFIGLRLTDVELDLLDQGAACLSISRSEYLRKLLEQTFLRKNPLAIRDGLSMRFWLVNWLIQSSNNIIMEIWKYFFKYGHNRWMDLHRPLRYTHS